MTARIEWVTGNCRLLASISAQFGQSMPLRGMTIGTGIHLEPKTVARPTRDRDGPGAADPESAALQRWAYHPNWSRSGWRMGLG